MQIIRKLGFNLAILVLLTALSKSIAVAGDYASRDVIGFSPDGRFFAFEQYGVQDGSGFPYSEIFIVDTDNDSWVEGSPIKVLIETEISPTDIAREQARSHAEPLLKRHQISVPGEHLASNPRAEVSADPHVIAVNIAHHMTPPAEEIVRFAITEKPLPSDRCSAFSDAIKGYVLTMSHAGKDTVLHDDARLPESRGCPLGYSFADVYYLHSGGTRTFVILLHMQQVGFEGPDSRFLAVTARLP